ncbi:hypothetical protein [Deinococcus aestuarii]|uniref:hypothetical protein n=1 Tax=Deinococcus aestuarii TaxID=2774531 RepID=UPI001C0C07A5|nr:hypothetical protein [Deinococcus aestuarii]
MLQSLLVVVAGLFGGGVLIALGFLVHLGWFWWTGQDYRGPGERAWERTAGRPAPSRRALTPR